MSGKPWTLSAAWFDEARLAEDGSPHLDPETRSPKSEVGSPVFTATVIAKAGKEVATNVVSVVAEDGVGVATGTFDAQLSSLNSQL